MWILLRISLEELSLLSVSQLYSLLLRKYLYIEMYYVLFRIPGTWWAQVRPSLTSNVVAERMRYPHPCVFNFFKIHYNFRSKNQRWAFYWSDNEKNILADDTTPFPTVYNFLGFHKTPQYFFLPAIEASIWNGTQSVLLFDKNSSSDFMLKKVDVLQPKIYILWCLHVNRGLPLEAI